MSAAGLCRHRDGCTAWIWCAEESGCTDDRGQEIPFRGCQLKNEPMQAWGLPSASLAASMKVANSYSGYIKREGPSAPLQEQGPHVLASKPSVCLSALTVAAGHALRSTLYRQPCFSSLHDLFDARGNLGFENIKI